MQLMNIRNKVNRLKISSWDSVPQRPSITASSKAYCSPTDTMHTSAGCITANGALKLQVAHQEKMLLKADAVHPPALPVLKFPFNRASQYINKTLKHRYEYRFTK